MMSTNHTPGPWQVTAYNPEKATVDIETVERGRDVPQKGYFIARIYSAPDGPSADALLVSAAPELLEALRYLLQQTIDQDRQYGIALTAGESDAETVARAAIAKAEGRTVEEIPE